MKATTDMKATVITARLDGKVHRQLKELATREDRSVSWLVRRAIEGNQHRIDIALVLGVDAQQLRQIVSRGVSVKGLYALDVSVRLGVVAEETLLDELRRPESRQGGHLRKVVLRVVLDRPEVAARLANG